ncbi:NUDIX hydrolase [soil metagenome]|jgi:8-oxo-dGTP pyrophosphatase MutT (NUDIX family)|nr:NUDIX domain-containing protein [Pyrinomonadaceae bacterium]
MKDNQSNQTAKFQTVEQVSAGGAAFRRTADGYEIAIISVVPSRRWQLPKGLIDAGETPEIAALREVREEAGIETELLAPVEKIEYWYVGEDRGERVRFHKSVHFFLLAYRSGVVENHDAEVAEARWVKIAEAVQMLAFKGEKEVVEKAVKLLPKFSDKIS